MFAARYPEKLHSASVAQLTAQAEMNAIIDFLSAIGIFPAWGRILRQRKVAAPIFE